MNNQLTIIQKKKDNQSDPYFYEGLIAEYGRYSLEAVGIPSIWSFRSNSYENHTNEYQTDQDLEDAEDKANDINIDFYQESNWFEIFDYCDPCFTSDIIFDYDQGIDYLKHLYNKDMNNND